MKTARKTNGRLGERIVHGRDLELPLVEWVAAVRSQSALRITWHAHDQFEMLFLLEGSTAYEFDDQQTVELPGGHFLLIPPGARHRGLHDVRRPTTLCGILFDPRRSDAARHTPLAKADVAWLRQQCQAAVSGRSAEDAPAVVSESRARALGPKPSPAHDEPRVRAIPMSADLRRLASQLAPLLEDVLARRPAAGAALRLGVCATLIEAARQLSAPRAIEPTRAVQQAIRSIEARFAEDLSMDDVARAAGCSRARLFVLFKQSTGMTPHAYLQRLRVNRAQQALADSQKPITQVALECGFATSQYFSSVFRKYTGLSPTAFRDRGA